MGRVWHELQRSRTRVSAESTPIGDRWSLAEGASTEPHSCECGEKPEIICHGSIGRASTEPHSCECGESNRGMPPIAFVNASTEPHSCECGEGRRVGRGACPRCGASTEPHSCECGEARRTAGRS